MEEKQTMDHTEDQTENQVQEQTGAQAENQIQERTEDQAGNQIQERTEDQAGNQIQERSGVQAENQSENLTAEKASSHGKGKRLRKCACGAAAIFVFLVLYAFFTRLLEPKYATELVEGSMISEYYGEAGGHDVIFVGDCEVYANFSPLEMYRQEGITSWVRGSPHQLLWQSYYILEETFSYETPQAVVLNVGAMRYSEPVSEPYNRLTIDYMCWSPSKVGIILSSMTEGESFWSYVFPLLRYHSRFSELTAEDITYFFKTKYSTWNGYQMNKEISPVETLPAKRTLADYSFGDACWEYLDKIREICSENGTELILVKAPSVYPYWYDEYDEQIAEYADSYGLTYYNFLEVTDEIGIDYSTDTYDAGQHLNLSGATKLSVWFSKILAEEHGIPDRSGEKEIAEEYEAKLKLYDAAAED